jgi:hypothetical protein
MPLRHGGHSAACPGAGRPFVGLTAWCLAVDGFDGMVGSRFRSVDLQADSPRGELAPRRLFGSSDPAVSTCPGASSLSDCISDHQADLLRGEFHRLLQ